MRILFGGIVVGIIAVAAYVLVTAGAPLAQLAMVLGNL
jgi:hypothetical protein